MTPLELQEGNLQLFHFSSRINEISDEVNFYRGPIERFDFIPKPALVLFMKLVREGAYGEELEFEYLKVLYFNSINKPAIPTEATHFALIEEPPITANRASILIQRFKNSNINFPLRYPLDDSPLD